MIEKRPKIMSRLPLLNGKLFLRGRLGWACDSQDDRKGALTATQRAAELEPFNQDYQWTYERFKVKK